MSKTKPKKDEIIDESTSNLLSSYRKSQKKYLPLLSLLSTLSKEESHLNEIFISDQLDSDYIINLFKVLSSVKDINKQLGYKHIKSIRLWNVDLYDTGLKSIKDYIQDNNISNIKTIELINCKISEESCMILSEILHPKDAFDIQTLILDYNLRVSNNGIRNLMNGLKYNTSITYLSLAYSNISYDGVVYLKEIFDKQSFLLVLSLEGNPIETKGAQDLMNYITETSPLEELNLKNTMIVGDNDFTNCVVSMMNSNLSLGVYNLYMNHFNNDFLSSVIDTLQSQKASKDLHVYQFYLSPVFSNELYEKFFLLMNGRKKPKKKGKKRVKSGKK